MNDAISGSGFVWVISPTKAFPDLLDWQIAGIKQGILAIGYKFASDMEAWMKANAPWTDRTGNARQSIFALADELVNAVVLTFGHTMSYSKYLEFKNQGRFSVIGPAIDHFLPLLWADIKALLS